MGHYSSVKSLKTVRFHISGDITLYGAPSARTIVDEPPEGAPRSTGDDIPQPGLQQQNPMRQFAELWESHGGPSVPRRFAQKA